MPRTESADPHIPDLGEWPDLDPLERERRAAILADVRYRVAVDGPRVAVGTPGRGRLFMPFAALKGYGEMIAEGERAEQE